VVSFEGPMQLTGAGFICRAAVAVRSMSPFQGHRQSCRELVTFPRLSKLSGAVFTFHMGKCTCLERVSLKGRPRLSGDGLNPQQLALVVFFCLGVLLTKKQWLQQAEPSCKFVRGPEHVCAVRGPEQWCSARQTCSASQTCSSMLRAILLQWLRCFS